MPVDCVRGFLRETLIEMTTNIESQEHHRRLKNDAGYAGHPRAGGTESGDVFQYYPLLPCTAFLSQAVQREMAKPCQVHAHYSQTKRGILMNSLFI